MPNTWEKERLQLLQETEEHFLDLTGIWRKVYDANMCTEYVMKLKNRINEFYDDLKEQSYQNEQKIRMEIQVLQEEAGKLCRLLRAEMKLPAINDCNVPLQVFQLQIEKIVLNLKEEYRRRHDEINELLLEQDALCNELGEQPLSLLADPLPTAEEVINFRQHLEQLNSERIERVNEIYTLRLKVSKCLEILEEAVDTDADYRLLHEKEFKLDVQTLTALRGMQKKYENRVTLLNEKIEEIRKKLVCLWERLNTSPSTRQKFNHYVDCTNQTYIILKEEVKRCETLQSENIQQCVQQVRSEIVKWWDKTMKSEKDRRGFTNFNSSCYTDDLLTLHEMELEDLKQFYEENREIYELYDTRKQLWERMTALEAKACDAARLNNRGGQLLKEEKERKIVAAKLPKIEQQIKDLAQAYEDRTKQEFLINGENILHIILQDWDKKRTEKAKISSARNNSHASLLSAGRTPKSARNASISTISKKTSASTPTPSSTKKIQKLSMREIVPSAKRRLMYRLSCSKSAFNTTSTSSRLPTKSPYKKPSVVPSSICRKSVQQGSANKKSNLVEKIDKESASNLIINKSGEWHMDKGTDDNYDTFHKSVQPDARSTSIPADIHQTSNFDNMRSKLLQKETDSRLLRQNTAYHPTKPSKIPTAGSNANTPCFSTVRTPTSTKMGFTVALQSTPSSNNIFKIPTPVYTSKKRKLPCDLENVPSAKRSLIHPPNTPKSAPNVTGTNSQRKGKQLFGKSPHKHRSAIPTTIHCKPVHQSSEYIHLQKEDESRLLRLPDPRELLYRSPTLSKTSTARKNLPTPYVLTGHTVLQETP